MENLCRIALPGLHTQEGREVGYPHHRLWSQASLDFKKGGGATLAVWPLTSYHLSDLSLLSSKEILTLLWDSSSHRRPSPHAPLKGDLTTAPIKRQTRQTLGSGL